MSVALTGLPGRYHEIRQHPGSLVSDVGVTRTVAQLQLGQHPGHVGLQVPHGPRRLDETGFMDADGHLDPVRGVQLDQDV